MTKSYYAFYGSLRRGMRLHDQFKNELHYEYSAWLKGYDLYSLGNYPYAINSSDGNHKILVEVMSIKDPLVEETIHKIEVDAGYHAKQIKIGNDQVTIFIFNEPANNLRIDSGDWFIFFRQ